MRLCLVAGCLTPTEATRCTLHEAEWQRERGDRRGKGRWANAPFRRVPIPAGAVCACCGVGEDLTRHHVIPLSVGPSVHVLPDWCGGFDLVAMCRRCNSSIGDRIMLTRECPMHGGTPGAVEKFGG